MLAKWVGSADFERVAQAPSVWASMFQVKWHDRQPMGPAGEPRALFDRKPTKPPHKLQGFAQ